MEPPNRSPSPNPLGTPIDSSSSSSPKGSPKNVEGAPRIPIPRSPAINIRRIKLNDGNSHDSFSSINSATKVKEVKDTIKQKTLIPICELWKTKKYLEEEMSKMTSRSAELPARKQALVRIEADLAKLEIDNYELDFFLVELKALRLSSGETEEFCIYLLEQNKIKKALDYAKIILTKEVDKTTKYETINRESGSLEQCFITAFQKFHLDKHYKVKATYTPNYNEEATDAAKRLVQAIKEIKDPSIKELYKTFHKAVEKKFPGHGDEMLLSLMILRYLGPSFMKYTIVDGLRKVPDNSVGIVRVVNSFVTKISPPKINLTPEFMDKGYQIIKDALPFLISKP